MKARAASLLILGVFVGLGSVSCGRGNNPAEPSSPAVDAAAPTEATPSVGYGDEGDVSASTLAVAPFNFTDGCNDGRGIQLRFWEAQNGRLTGRSTRILKIRSGGGLRVRLTCLRGRSNCVGATTNPLGGATWGVGLNGERRPSSAFCKACTTTTVNMRFLCTRRLDADGFVDEGLIVDEE